MMTSTRPLQHQVLLYWQQDILMYEIIPLTRSHNLLKVPLQLLKTYFSLLAVEAKSTFAEELRKGKFRANLIFNIQEAINTGCH